MTIATPAEMADALAAAGFSAAEIPTGVAIGLVESYPPGNTDSTHINNDGSVDRGVWQINSINSDVIAREGGNPFDLYACARMARDIYLRQGWQAWSTYTSGKYQTVTVDPAAYSAVPAKGSPKPQGKPDWKGVLPGPNYLPLPSLPGIPDSVSHFFAVLNNPDFWKRFSVGLLGYIVASIGVVTMLLSSREGQTAASAVTTLGVKAAV